MGRGGLLMAKINDLENNQGWRVKTRDGRSVREALKLHLMPIKGGELSSLFDFKEVMNNNHNQEPPPQNGPPLMVKPNGNFIHSFDDMMRKFLSKYFSPSMVTKLRNEITKFEKKPHESLFEAWERYKLAIDQCPNHNMLLVTQIDTFYNGLTLSHRDTINAAAGGTFMQKIVESA
uniref:Reverse transcriptase domain-containing protein n=1 Tax=Tanacetum cinerariifolium TaxID=118510 RepID=A0A6L2JJE7_TANCI|nr:reverse transcriptase domain-containing protein [Tanacetum cinerariifolium]